MRKIILDGKVVEKYVRESLPMLIHGTHGSGASLYTICLASKWFAQGYKILFLCGYPEAEEAFGLEVGSEYTNVQFFTKENADSFITVVSNADDNTIIIVKNIELFESNVLEAVDSFKNLIISGDVENAKVKDALLNTQFATEVYFSSLDGKELPHLDKFHGLVISGDYKGITNLV